MLDMALQANVVKKSGSWFTYDGDQLGQGRENAKGYLREHPEVMETLDRQIREHYHFGTEGAETDAEEK